MTFFESHDLCDYREGATVVLSLQLQNVISHDLYCPFITWRVTLDIGCIGNS